MTTTNSGINSSTNSSANPGMTTTNSGINAQTLHFLDVFLMHCLLADSPPDSPQEIADMAHNQHLTAARGRESGLELQRHGQPVKLADWGHELLAAMTPVAQRLDAELAGTPF
jgi:glutamate--cysteine ligase